MLTSCKFGVKCEELIAHANNGASPIRHRATGPPANSTHAAELSVATDPDDPLGKR